MLIIKYLNAKFVEKSNSFSKIKNLIDNDGIPIKMETLSLQN